MGFWVPTFFRGRIVQIDFTKGTARILKRCDNDHEQFVEKAYLKIAEELERKLPTNARRERHD